MDKAGFNPALATYVKLVPVPDPAADPAVLPLVLALVLPLVLPLLLPLVLPLLPLVLPLVLPLLLPLPLLLVPLPPLVGLIPDNGLLDDVVFVPLVDLKVFVLPIEFCQSNC